MCKSDGTAAIRRGVHSSTSSFLIPLPSFLYVFRAFISFSVASKTVHYMKRPFKGYPNVLVCALMGPEHSKGGRETGYISVFVSVILCVNCYIAVSVLSV